MSTAAVRRPLLVTVTLLAGLGACRKHDEKVIRVAAAANLAAALDEIGPAFRAKTGISIKVTPGASGALAKQLREEAPFDLFASADVASVDIAVSAGACDAATKARYARGRIVLWWRKDSKIAAPASLSDLADGRFQHIAIANPEHAPYGKAAQQALEKLGVWAQVKPRLVFGENIKQAQQFAATGNADVGIIALSLALDDKTGSYLAIDAALHAPLDQALVVCKHGDNAAGGKQLAAFITSPAGIAILARYGYELPGAAAPTPTPTPAKPPRALESKDVQAVVDAWLAAQNSGVFADYQALYATRMTGIKRVGLRTFHFDRKGWLADRERMFQSKSKMVVTAADVAIETGSTSATVRFQQSFTQGTFHDQGPKELLIVSDGGALKIAREELVSSRVDASASATGLTEALLVVELAGRAYAVIGDADPTWGSGPLSEPIVSGAIYAATQPVGAALPREQAAWSGRELAVYAADGTACPATIGSVELLAVVTPHFGTVAYWKGDGEPGADGSSDGPVPPAQIAAEVLASGAQLLVAELGVCRGVIALPAAVKPVFFAPLAPDAALTDKATVAFAALPEAKALQKSSDAFGRTGPWADQALRISAFEHDGQRYVTVYGRGGNGCGEWEGSLSAVFFVDRKGKLVPRENADGILIDVAAIADLDGDGSSEIIGITDPLTPAWAIVGDGGEGMPTTVKTVTFRYSDCPC